MDEEHVVAGNQRGEIMIWDISVHKMVKSFDNADAEIYSVAAHPSNPSLVAQLARPPMMIRLFDIRSGKWGTI